MKNAVALFFIFTATLFATHLTKNQDVNCGGQERWDVKTLSDSAATKVNFTPIQSSAPALRLLVPSQKIGNNTKRFDTEFFTYTIQCKVREYRIEEDGDTHLVLMDVSDTTQTIIGEIPN